MDLPRPFGPYQLLEHIATGGMAEVFLARSFGMEGFEKRLVIKRILPALARSPRLVQLFIREAKISVLLSHPNIVQVFDLGRVGDDWYIAMEFINGRDLTRTVRRMRAQGQRLPLPISVYVTAGLLRGLNYAHSRVDHEGKPLHIVHRDVSPHNVILSFQGEVKLVDFGIARLIGEEEGGQTGQPGGGKFAYMSPEQASGGAIDHRSDVFSTAIVLYELLVNHRLFQDPDPKEKLRRVREAEVPDPRLEFPDIPDRLWEILKKALSLDPEQRYPTAAHFEDELRAFLFDAGYRMSASELGAFLREQFADELTPDPASLQLQGMARELAELQEESATPSVSTPHSHSTGSHSHEVEGPEPRLVAEKKVAVALVAELVGATDASLDPHELAEREGQMLRNVRRIVQRYGGWMGGGLSHDTLTVLFGIPRVHEDDLERALLCAQDLVRTFSRARKRSSNVELAVGIHRGEVAVTGQGEDLAIVPRGDMLKHARRLAQAAEPSEVHVSEEIAANAGDRWHFDPGARLRPKGHREERPSFKLAGQRRRRAGGAGRWIRRGNELELLAQAMVQLSQGVGGVIGIQGAAGTGKSRLVREIRELASRARVPFYQARALPWGGDAPMAPFREWVAAALSIEEDMSPERVRERLRRLNELKLAAAEVRLVEAWFGLAKAPDAGNIEHALAAATAFVRGLAAEGPMLVVMEDTHHLAPEEEWLLDRTIQATSEERVLWLLTSRGELPPAAKDRARIQLGPLSEPARTALAADVLAARAVTPELVEVIDRGSQGNALAIVELSRALLQKNLVIWEDRVARLANPEADPGLPPTLEGLIAARVDALDPGNKGALQIAATIGMSFSGALLAEAAGLEEADAVLRDLVEAGLVVPEAEGRHAFANRLIWEVVRRSVLRVQLRDHHRMVAEAIERMHSLNLHPWAEVLAQHQAAAGRPAEAARYAGMAGDHLRSGGHLDRALASYRAGIDWLSEAWKDGDRFQEREALLQLGAGEVSLLLGDAPAAERHLEVAVELAEDLGLGSVAVGSHLALGRMHLANGELAQAEAHLEQGLEEAQLSGEASGQVALLEALAGLACDEGRFEDAERMLREALELAGDDANLAALAQLGLGTRFLREDRPERAWEWLERARKLGERAKDPILLGRIINNQGIVLHSLGRYDRAVEYFREALELRESCGYRQGMIINLHNLADTFLRQQEPGKAHAAFTRSRDLAADLGQPRWEVLNGLFLSYIEALRGDADLGERELRAGIAAARRLADDDSVLTGRRLLGRLLSSRGRQAEGRLELEGALADARRLHLPQHVRDLEAELL